MMKSAGQVVNQNRSWTKRLEEKIKRMDSVKDLVNGMLIPTDRIVDVMEKVIRPYDRVVLEGNNQKQASFLSKALAQINPKKLFDLHMIMSSISRPEHLDLFEYGIAKKIDFAYAGPQSLRMAQMLEDGKLSMGEIHTYIELYGRLS
jgi:malonate decarboxylase alpha subunit